MANIGKGQEVRDIGICLKGWKDNTKAIRMCDSWFKILTRIWNRNANYLTVRFVIFNDPILRLRKEVPWIIIIYISVEILCFLI